MATLERKLASVPPDLNERYAHKIRKRAPQKTGVWLNTFAQAQLGV